MNVQVPQFAVVAPLPGHLAGFPATASLAPSSATVARRDLDAASDPREDATAQEGADAAGRCEPHDNGTAYGDALVARNPCAVPVFAVAALYVDTERGPYPAIAGVDAWGIERDATTYAGPWPVVAHPPCGHWGRFGKFARDDGSTGPIAVAQVRRWGGVLEHPEASRLFRRCQMPRPGELPDPWGGITVCVDQCDFGHKARKRTSLYVVGFRSMPPFPAAGTPTHVIGARYGVRSGGPPPLPKSLRHLTPVAFAVWLVEIAANCRPVPPRGLTQGNICAGRVESQD